MKNENSDKKDLFSTPAVSLCADGDNNCSTESVHIYVSSVRVYRKCFSNVEPQVHACVRACVHVIALWLVW